VCVCVCVVCCVLCLVGFHKAAFMLAFTAFLAFELLVTFEVQPTTFIAISCVFLSIHMIPVVTLFYLSMYSACGGCRVVDVCVVKSCVAGVLDIVVVCWV